MLDSTLPHRNPTFIITNKIPQRLCPLLDTMSVNQHARLTVDHSQRQTTNPSRNHGSTRRLSLNRH